MEDQIKHYDFLGQELNENEFVIAGQGHELSIYRIMRFTTKMVRVVNIKAQTRVAKKGKLRYSKELLKVDPQLVTYHLMRKQQ